jgi:histidyl-tRNA synthetase
MGRPKKNTAPAASKNHPILGSKYILSDSNLLWSTLLKRLQKTSRMYGFSRVELPLVEETKVYERYGQIVPAVAQVAAPITVGEDTQVQLRASLLPSVLNAYASSKLYEEPHLHKWMYMGNAMQAIPGGLQSSYQFGFEVFGGFNHLTEAQVMGAVWYLVTSLGVQGVTLEINTIGTPECQESYQNILQDFLKQKKFSLCDNCNEEIGSRPFNVLRCNNEECTEVTAEAPTILDYLDQSSHKHFTNILEALDELQVPYQLNPLYVGTEGASRTNFVVKYKHGDKMEIIGEGAYHDELLGKYIGKPHASFGFVGNLNTLYEAMEAAEVEIVQEYSTEVFLVPLGELAAKKSLRLFQDLLSAHISVYDHFGDVGVKNQLKQAEVYK